MDNRVVHWLVRRVQNMIFRALIVRIDDGPKMQEAQLAGRAEETKDGLEHWLPYGYHFYPLPSANGQGPEGIVLALESGLRVLLPVADRRHRPAGVLAPGEAMVYDDQGQKIHLKRNGIVVSGLNVLIETPGVLRLDGDKVEIHGRTSLQIDVHGKGSRETWTGGAAWHTESYVDGAATSSDENGIAQPAVESEHPDNTEE